MVINSVKSASFDVADGTRLLNKTAETQPKSSEASVKDGKSPSDNNMNKDIVDISEEGVNRLKAENAVS